MILHITIITIEYASMDTKEVLVCKGWHGDISVQWIQETRLTLATCSQLAVHRERKFLGMYVLPHSTLIMSTPRSGAGVSLPFPGPIYKKAVLVLWLRLPSQPHLTFYHISTRDNLSRRMRPALPSLLLWKDSTCP